MNTAKIFFMAIGAACVLIAAVFVAIEPFGNSPTNPSHWEIIGLVYAGVAALAVAAVLNILQARKRQRDEEYRAGVTVVHGRRAR